VTGRAHATGVTGVGSLPGDDIDAALPAVFDDWSLPYLPELPARGAGADMLGRTAAALVDLHVDLQPAGWRLVARSGIDEARAAALLERDLDALVAHGAGYAGAFKVQLVGPWTLAAGVELPRGGRALRDAGAVRDLAESLAVTVTAHVEDVRRRLPGADVVVQLDEPSLPAVLAGRVATESRFETLPRVEPSVVRERLGIVTAAATAAGAPVVVHCCAAEVPFGLLAEAGVSAVSFDLSVVRVDADELAERWERGLDLWPGVVPALPAAAAPDVDAVTRAVRELARRLDVAVETFAARSVLTPVCGLAGASPDWVRSTARTLRAAYAALTDVAEAVPR
jgi:hypothetical protein